MKGLDLIVQELKAPKAKFNSFGQYNYRSCEDILEAVKPLLKSHGLSMILTDKPICVGSWNYIEATAIISDGETTVTVSASAREAEMQKGMGEAQITGSASSYARKYALNGLFLIDDNQDDDGDNGSRILMTAEQKNVIMALRDDHSWSDNELSYINRAIESENLTNVDAEKVIKKIKSKPQVQKKAQA